jgi:hypothetical protein
MGRYHDAQIPPVSGCIDAEDIDKEGSKGGHAEKEIRINQLLAFKHIIT